MTLDDDTRKAASSSLVAVTSASILPIASSRRHLTTSMSANSVVSEALVSFIDLSCASNVSTRRFDASNKLSSSSRNISSCKIWSL